MITSVYPNKRAKYQSYHYDSPDAWAKRVYARLDLYLNPRDKQTSLNRLLQVCPKALMNDYVLIAQEIIGENK